MSIKLQSSQLRTGIVRSELANSPMSPSPQYDTISRHSRCSNTRNSIRNSIMSSWTTSTLRSRINPYLTNLKYQFKTSLRSSKSSSSTTTIPPALMKIHRNVHDWVKRAEPNATHVFRLEQSLDGESVAYMFHMTLNSNFAYGYEIVYASTSRFMHIRKLQSVQNCMLPEMKIVGIPVTF